MPLVVVEHRMTPASLRKSWRAYIGSLQQERWDRQREEEESDSLTVPRSFLFRCGGSAVE